MINWLNIVPRGCDGVGAALKERARFDADGFFIDTANPRLGWIQSNFSLVLSNLDPADTGDWFCTVNGRSQYLHRHTLLVRGRESGTRRCWSEVGSQELDVASQR